MVDRGTSGIGATHAARSPAAGVQVGRPERGVSASIAQAAAWSLTIDRRSSPALVFSPSWLLSSHTIDASGFSIKQG